MSSTRPLPFLVLALCLALCLACSSPQPESAAADPSRQGRDGESCGRTADCASPLRCFYMQCRSAEAQTVAALPMASSPPAPASVPWVQTAIGRLGGSMPQGAAVAPGLGESAPPATHLP
ncbi:MAG: hypothetical protein EXR76_06045 [Myxococcales bacterium]|nr:hypothetical protein [Myxococcales bacterium]